ncbi:MAG: hypothetical protein ABR512_15270, partial [Desulfopila sp.]
KGFCVYHQFRREILEAFFTHTDHVLLGEILKVSGTFEAESVLFLAEYDGIGVSFADMPADNPDGDLAVFFALYFFGHDTPYIFGLPGLGKKNNINSI